MPRESYWLPPQYLIRLRVYASLAALLGAIVVSLAGFAFVIAFAWPATDLGSPTARVLAGSVDDFEVGKPVTYTEGKFHLVKREDGSFIALYWRSTHLGCSVPWRPDFVFGDASGRKKGWFRDPCSGSTFDVHGRRVFGPAPRDLDQFPVEVVGGEVFVHATEQDLILGTNRAVLCTDPPEGGRVIPCP